MKDIDGIDKAISILQPHWDDIEADFNRHNQNYLQLLSADHEPIGKILRAHLVVENFLDSFLVNYYEFSDYKDLGLTFAQKAKLLPSKHSSAASVRPGIIQLNIIRNKFGHRLGYEIERESMSAIYQVLQYARPKKEFVSAVEAIEAFAAVACAFLSIPPKHLEALFSEAFADVYSYTPG